MSRPRKPPIAVRYQVATHGHHKPLRIVLHDTESHDHAGIGDIVGIAEYWHRQGQGLGAHFIIDGDGNIGQGCGRTNVTWAVAGHNTGSIHIELIGFARFTLAGWLKRRKQLDALVDLLAYLCDRANIPARHSIDRGVARHADFHNVPPGMYHSDPGKGFPFRRVLRRVRRKLGQ